MRLRRIEKFDEELRSEIQELWNSGKLDSIIELITRYFSLPAFHKKFSITLNFDLVVHSDSGKKWHIVPLAMIAPGMSPSPAVWREWLEAKQTGNVSKKRLAALRKRLESTSHFSGVSFGIIPRGKYKRKVAPSR